MARFRVRYGDVVIDYEHPSDTEVADKFKEVMEWLKGLEEKKTEQPKT